MLYDYKCTKCEYKREVSLSIANRDSLVGTQCIFCGDGVMVRVPTSVPFILGNKGNCGWASNGYADNTVGNTREFKENGIYTKGED